MTDTTVPETHQSAAAVAGILAAQGYAARVVPFQHTHGVEVRLERETESALWSYNIDAKCWGYIFFEGAEDAKTIGAQGAIESLVLDTAPERIAHVIAHFPYGGEMDEAEVRDAVTELLATVEGMSEEQRTEIIEQVVSEPERVVRPLSWDELRESGLTWALNRYVLNPIGYSFVMQRDGEDVGWVIVGDGNIPATMDPLADAHGAQKFSSFLDALRHDG